MHIVLNLPISLHLLKCCSPLLYVCILSPPVFSIKVRGSKTASADGTQARAPPLCAKYADKDNDVPLPATANGGERDGLELLIVCQGQTVLHRLFQKFLTLVSTPDRTVTVDHKLGRQAVTCADSSWRGRDGNSEFCPAAGYSCPMACIQGGL